MAIVLVEQFFDFARDLCDRFTLLDRGRVIATGAQVDMTADLRNRMAI